MDTTRVQEYCMVGEVTVVEKVVELDRQISDRGSGGCEMISHFVSSASIWQ